MGSGAGSGGGSGAYGLMSRAGRLDLYRRIPRDLTETSALGAVLSLISIALLLTLFVFQVKAALAVDLRTRIDVDHSEDGTFQVNFKITLPELSCEWAAVESVDIVGHRRRHDLGSSAIYKLPIGGRVVSLEHAAKTVHPAALLPVGLTTDMDHYGGRRIATELTPAYFDVFVREHDAVMIVFHAPWCPHCRAFAPVWEHAAELVLQRLAAQHASRTHESAPPPRVSLGSVDCTVRENVELCKRAHIQAFPTVRVYRGGKEATVFDDEAHTHYESYTGARTAEAVADFAMEAAREVRERVGQVSGADVSPGAYSLGWQPPGTDSDKDGVKESRVLSRGCTLEGSVQLARVPGELLIVPHAAGHSIHLEHTNMTHKIEHLSFGTFVPSRAMYGSLAWNQRRVFSRLPKDAGGKFAAAVSMHPPFVSTEEYDEHHHHFKVVYTSFQPLDRKAAPISLYEYTVNSFAHRLEPPFMVEGEAHDGPVVRLSYDVSPVQVTLQETRKPLLESLLGMCAILGGVYTCSVMLESLLQTLHANVKKAVGKNT